MNCRVTVWGVAKLRLSAVVLATVCASSAAHAGDLEDIRRLGELRWGGDLQGGEPYVFEDATVPGRIQGFEVDIAESIARRLGVRAKFQQTDWSSLLATLTRGDFDIILNGLEDTPKRREAILLSVPYFVYGETLTVRKDSPYVRLSDLKGKRVGTLNQTVAHDLLTGQPLEVVLYEGQQEPYADLVNQRTEAVLLDHIIADRYGCSLPGLRCIPEDVARGTYVIGMQRGHRALKEAVDGALQAAIREGELQSILEKWKLWDARQAALSPAARTRDGSSSVPAAEHEQPETSDPSSATEARESAPSRRFTAGHVALFLEGAWMTLLLSVSSFLLASPLGVLLALARLYGGRGLRGVAHAYVELFRGTPLLLQLYVLYFGLADVVRLNPISAAILGLGLNYAAYEAEVHRGALAALPRGQSEAARALGLSRWQTIRHVLLPQSLRTALPAVTNDFVALLKDSSLVSVITVVELTKRMTIVAADLRDWVLPGLACAGLYLLMSFPLAHLARRLEREAPT